MEIELKYIRATTTTTETPEGVTTESGVVGRWQLTDVGLLEADKSNYASRGKRFVPAWLTIQATTGQGGWNDGVTIGGRVLKKDGTPGERQASNYHRLVNRDDVPEWARPLLDDVIRRTAELEG
jgi:hypothetical protein